MKGSVSSSAAAQQHDIVIVGGGVVGLTALILFAEAGFNVALLDKKTPDCNIAAEELPRRVLAINKNSQDLLDKISAWKNILHHSKWSTSFETMKVFDAASGGELLLDSADCGGSALGWVVEQKFILHELSCTAAELQKQGKCTLYYNFQPDKLAASNPNNGFYWHLHCVPANDGSPGDALDLEADLLIAADGVDSWLRDKLQIKTTCYDYHQQAIVCVVQHQYKHNYSAQQVFLDSGPLAFLPLADPYFSSIVWSLPHAIAEKAVHESDLSFANNLSNAFDCRLGWCKVHGAKFSFPLIYQQAQQYSADHALLIGDAAHHVHPLAGQGANLGLADVACMYSLILQAKNNNNSISSARVLRKYARQRYAQNSAMHWVIDIVKESFSSQNAWSLPLRKLGFSRVQKNDCLKSFIVNFAD